MDISRRSFIELAAVTAANELVPSLSGARLPKSPNILFMLGDDHRWDALGCTGNSVVRTSQLDGLSEQGVVFDNNFCTTPICCASRASIMTGQYAATTGIYDFDTPLSTEQIKRTYWHRLKMAGYHIGFIGKFGVGDTMPSEEFDYWRGLPDRLCVYFPDGPSGPHLTDIMRDQANEFFQQAPRDKPFCLSISFKAPHVEDDDPRQYLPSRDTLPLYEELTIPPLSRAGSDDIRRFPMAIQRSESRRRWAVRFATPDLYQASMKGYYRLISGIDGAVGSIRETLAKLGLADNTIIIYSADHGIFNGEHGLAGKWYGHEESIRTPLIIYDPRLPANSRGKRRRAMTLNIDLNPTILEMAGLKPSELTQGRSLFGLLQEDQSESRRVWFFEHNFPYRGWIPSSEGIRTRRWKYIRYTDFAAPYEELYDLEHDKFETNTLIGQAQYEHQRFALAAYTRIWSASLHKQDSWVEPITEKDLRQDGLT